MARLMLPVALCVALLVPASGCRSHNCCSCDSRPGSGDGSGSAFDSGSTPGEFGIVADVVTYDAGVAPQPAFIGQVPCLDYDGVTTVPTTDPYVITPQVYDQHLKWLYENGYTPMTFRSYIEKLSSGTFPGNDFPARPVLIFSDTTWEWFDKIAMPLLHKYKFTATIGLEANHIGEPYALTRGQISALERRGIEVASHSNSHADLTTVSDAQLQAEVSGSRSTLRGYGWNVTDFIYPYGACNAKVVSAVKAAGYAAARGTGAADLSGGGYSALDLGRRYTMGCALPINSTSMSQFISYMKNPRLELEDLFVVERDAGSLVSIRRENDFTKDSYGSVYMADRGDAVSFKIYVYKPGNYNLTFRVKTGVQGAELNGTRGYSYTLNGKALSFVASGPTTVEQQYLVWGNHKMTGIRLDRGFSTFVITTLTDWAVVLDYALVEYVGS
jgi:peptidoglycan/xylan/chitin deacetylase (PgdA/CDA1 family)